MKNSCTGTSVCQVGALIETRVGFVWLSLVTHVMVESPKSCRVSTSYVKTDYMGVESDDLLNCVHAKHQTT